MTPLDFARDDAGNPIYTCAAMVYAGSLIDTPAYCDEEVEVDGDYCPGHTRDDQLDGQREQPSDDQLDAWLRQDDDNARGDN